ncbi:MAG: hypothetical protein GX251_11240 [Firmicutes bacterium]|nr:hypothetical protein [Bacillota bacterium]
MSLFVYEKALDYTSSDRLLLDIRQTVSQLRKSDPKLKSCSLADVSLKRNKTGVNVTLFFQS